MVSDESRFAFGEAERANALTLIAMALSEDLGPDAGVDGDITARATIPDDAVGAARFAARSPGVACGLPILPLLIETGGFRLEWRSELRDGDSVEPGAIFGRVAGRMRDLLAMERTALNFVQRLSGVATLTSRFVQAIAGTKAVLLDTRKTTPGWRALEKYAVRCGGGRNHRIGLHDMILIKDNHLAWLAQSGAAAPIAQAVAEARRLAPSTPVEVEVDSLEQLDEALACRPDFILADNFGPDALSEALRRRDAVAPGVWLEVSGGVNLSTAPALARSGVDRISVGALTHSATALDIGLDYDEPRSRPADSA